MFRVVMVLVIVINDFLLTSSNYGLCVSMRAIMLVLIKKTECIIVCNGNVSFYQNSDPAIISRKLRFLIVTTGAVHEALLVHLS